MKKLLFAHLALLASFSAWAAEPSAPQSLFDGRSFAGWEGDEKVFRIQDGAIVGGSLEHKLPHNEFLCTKRQYGDFELHVKFKLLGDKVNAGIQFRSQRVTEGPKVWEVSGFQADMADGYWGALYDESRRNKALVMPNQAEVVKVIHMGDWNEYVIRAQGDRIQLWINGHQTVDYTEKDPSMARHGVIALQIHGGPPSEAWYKDITIQEL